MPPSCPEYNRPSTFGSPPQADPFRLRIPQLRAARHRLGANLATSSANELYSSPIGAPSHRSYTDAQRDPMLQRERYGFGMPITRNLSELTTVGPFAILRLHECDSVAYSRLYEPAIVCKYVTRPKNSKRVTRSYNLLQDPESHVPHIVFPCPLHMTERAHTLPARIPPISGPQRTAKPRHTVPRVFW